MALEGPVEGSRFEENIAAPRDAEAASEQLSKGPSGLEAAAAMPAAEEGGETRAEVELTIVVQPPEGSAAAPELPSLTDSEKNSLKWVTTKAKVLDLAGGPKHYLEDVDTFARLWLKLKSMLSAIVERLGGTGFFNYANLLRRLDQLQNTHDKNEKEFKGRIDDALGPVTDEEVEASLQAYLKSKKD